MWPSGLLLLADASAIVIAIASFGRVTTSTPLIVSLALWLLAAGGYYRPRIRLSVIDALPGLVGRVVFALSLGGACRELILRQDALTADRFRVVVAAAALLVVIGRVLAYAVIGLARRGGASARRAVVMAEDETLQLVTRLVESTALSGLTIYPDPGPDGWFDVLIADGGKAGRAGRHSWL
ncbi:MAG: hypothetical protein GY929_08105 [Actinomycetia bacterium]|nr:hypothetical protein [Actinomycetes bacterium]MCP4225134.1 hypothetical protein [Actinomycetes bacterium]MCP5026235.1 hypothetical protein [Actinomycetes bacterium]